MCNERLCSNQAQVIASLFHILSLRADFLLRFLPMKGSLVPSERLHKNTCKRTPHISVRVK